MGTALTDDEGKRWDPAIPSPTVPLQSSPVRLRSLPGVRLAPPANRLNGQSTAKTMTTATVDILLLLHRVRHHRVVRLLEGLHVQLVLVLPRDVPSHGVVPRERSRTERTRHSDTLMTLPDMGTQIRLVAV